MEQHLNDIISHYGYFGIFGALVLGIVGLPIPDEMLLTYAGYCAFKGDLNFALASLVAFLGSATGITISYSIGHRLGLPFLMKFGPKIRITESRIKRVQDFTNKYGNFFLFIGYFLPGIRHLTAYMAGISKLNLRKFMLVAYSGAFVWVMTFIFLGHELGKRWGIIRVYIHRYSFYLLIICIIVVLAFFASKFIKKSKPA